MNDSVFSTLENFIGGSNLPSDLMVMAQMHLIEPDLMSSAPYPKESNTPQQSENEHQRPHQRIFNHSQKEQPQFNISVATSNASIATQANNTSQNFNVKNNGTDLGAGNSNVNAPSAFTNIPFVQIHTTDVQPQRGYNGSTFRRTVTNHEEIKSEPIKSESADAAKDRINCTPTPPGTGTQSRGSGGCNDCSRELSDVSDASGKENCASGALSTDGTSTVSAARAESGGNTLPAIFKCNQCLFIGLSENAVHTHMTAMHTGESLNNTNGLCTQIPCPGCENIFYSHISIATHLREDHLMSTEDTDVLMGAIKVNYNCAQQTSEKNGSRTVSGGEELPEKNTQRRSRIYLKNVDCLREPRREPIEQQDNLISENFFHFENDCNSMTNMMEDPDFIGMLAEGNMENNSNSMANHSHTSEQNYNQSNDNHNVAEGRNSKTKNQSQSKQKISIKSVDVLREPALLRRDYEMQSFNTFMNACNDLDNNINNENACNININNVDQFSYPTSNKPLLSSNDSNNVCPIDGNGAHNNSDDFEKSRRPKIYIKNVDILKEPMSFTSNVNAGNMQDPSATINFSFLQPPMSQSAIPYLDNVENLNASTPPVFDNTTALKQLPLGTLSEQYLFDSGSNNYMPSVSELPESFSYVNGPSNSSSFLIENNRYGSGVDCSELNSTHPSGSLPIMTEATPPPHSGLRMAIVNNTKSGETSMDTSPPTLHPLSASMSIPLTPTQTQKQKIFIKNVDILKEPQFQEQRGTLHLRTVDELNLMNKNEVQNLIAPNLDNTQTSGIVQEEELNENFNNLSTNAALPDMEEVVPAGEALYDENDTFKLQDFTAQGVHNWSDDYDLGEDIREIITDTIAPVDTFNSAPLQKSIQELDTPQMTIISIRDIEELTNEHPQPINNAFECGVEVEQNSVLATIVDTSNANESVSNSVATQVDVFSSKNSSVITPNSLKQERGSSKLSGGQKHMANCHVETITTNFSEIPPLTLMSTNSATSHSTMLTPTKPSAVGCRDALPASSLPVPPLVPMSPLIPVNTSGSKHTTGPATSASISPASGSVPTERGRIYVANNLMQVTPFIEKQIKAPIAVSVTGGTSVRGRPFGSNRTGITKMRKQHDKATAIGVYVKCTIVGCAFRFKKTETLEYHLKCHNSNVNPPSPQAMLCPECKSTEFTNWNTLHTHLWRTHKVDMELYSCELCTFKTPIYSRLLNTHSKIHYEDRNYKCDQCEKAFKNTKQLKNHRRWHRNHATAATTVTKTTSGIEDNMEEGTVSTTARTYYRCKDCDAVFSHRKSLREHVCKNAETPVQCEVCERVLSSKSSLKLHMQTHETIRRFKCNTCDYTSNDHNAFRRHKMTHENTKMYKCAHCSYKSIQSVAYQKHIQQKHPEIADSVIYKCNVCHYATINHALYTMHCVKHEGNNNILAVADKSKAMHDASCVESLEQIRTEALIRGDAVGVSGNESSTQTKIKVKSRLMLSPPEAPLEDNAASTMTSPVQSMDIVIT